jgi:hypothetical protein
MARGGRKDAAALYMKQYAVLAVRNNSHVRLELRALGVVVSNGGIQHQYCSTN